MIDEQYLIQQIKTGSQKALETVIDRYGSYVKAITINNVILFDPDAGYMIIVAGMLDTGELEKIAKGLDIRVTDTPVSTSRLYTGINVINLGRG